MLLDLGNGRWLDPDSSHSPAYPRWPDLQGGTFDSLAAALLCAQALRRALLLEDPEAMWVGPGEVAEYTGLGQRAVDLRVRARLLGRPEAWPWTQVRGDRHVHLPELWEEVMWVANPHARAYLGVSHQVYCGATRSGLLRAEHRSFRGIDRQNLRQGLSPRCNAVYLPDVLRYRQLLALRRLFGKRFSYRQLERMLPLAPVTIARIKAGRLLVPRADDEPDE